jgi:hypothetical protein
MEVEQKERRGWYRCTSLASPHQQRLQRAWRRTQCHTHDTERVEERKYNGDFSN